VEDVQQFALVASGKLPLIVHADRVADIAQALKVQQQFGPRLVIIGGAEAWKLAAQLAQAKVGVILNGENNLPVSFDHLGARLDSAAILSQAGVEIAFSGENASTHNARNMRQVAGLAVAHGLPWEQAIRALSRSAAGLLGLDADVGQLQAGAVADLVVWDGDPLELDSYPSHVFIRGEVMDLSNRQTKLRDRYLDLKSELPPAYR
jgi:imidazolonepropionase-like amidohydrolase